MNWTIVSGQRGRREDLRRERERDESEALRAPTGEDSPAGSEDPYCFLLRRLLGQSEALQDLADVRRVSASI